MPDGLPSRLFSFYVLRSSQEMLAYALQHYFCRHPYYPSVPPVFFLMAHSSDGRVVGHRLPCTHDYCLIQVTIVSAIPSRFATTQSRSGVMNVGALHTVNCYRTHTHTHTHPLNGPLSGTTRVSQYEKGKTNLDFTEARDSEWQWHQLGHMQVCTSLQTHTTPAPHHSVFYRPDALPAAQPTASKH